MEVVKEVQVNSFAFLFGSFRIASKLPKVSFNQISVFINCRGELSKKNFQLVLGKSQEKALRESPPNCLVDPSLGTHLHVKINVSNIQFLRLKNI